MMGGDDPSFIKSLLEVFSSSIPPDLLDLNKALEAKDFNRISFVAHKMKSTIDNLCVDSLKKVIRELETKELNRTYSFEEIQEKIIEVNKVLTEVVEQMQLDYPN